VIARERWIEVCANQALPERGFLTLDILLYGGEIAPCLVFRFKGRVFAYRNQCVHMVRRLDGEQRRIFDEAGELLRCTMHGIVYQPETGESLSTLCKGEKLTAIKVVENEGRIFMADKRVSAIIGKGTRSSCIGLRSGFPDRSPTV